MRGFFNAKLMVEILQRLDNKPERGKLKNAVLSIKDFDLGVGEPVSFSLNRRQGLNRVYYTVVDEGRFVNLADWKVRFS